MIIIRSFNRRIIIVHLLSQSKATSPYSFIEYLVLVARSLELDSF